MDRLYEKIAEETGESQFIVETVLKHKFSWLRKQLKEMNNAAILLNNFGTFYVPASKIKTYVKYLDTVEEGGKIKDIPGEKEKYEEILKVISEYNDNKKIVNKRKKDE